MSHSRSSHLPAHPGAEGDLARLIATEHQLTARLESARAEAAALLAEARHQAETAARGVDAEVAHAVGELEQRIARRTAERIAELQASAEARAARFTQAGETATPRLADDVRRWLLSGLEASP
ncbi:MAG: hypothetical protein IPI92_00080 [Gemmatimonadetes bacterium]|nr:hypothetical protein [Gemmatimonadota bacterium]MBK7782876.1 hypothetical protein [Gemmatimonadota bacterium]